MRALKCEQLRGSVGVTAPALAALLLLAGCEGKNPGQPPECGNGVVDEAELCDGFNLTGETCLGLGLGGGALACQGDCRSYDLRGCEIQAECGNQVIEYPETCDGSDLDGQTCADFGYYSGSLACLPDCSGFDLGGCAENCGDGMRNGPESCDGEDVGGESCEALGYYSGSLRCAAGCQGFDESGCAGFCGDGACDRAYTESFTSCPDDCPGFVAISAGWISCAVASDGTAWCWGTGELGNPSQWSSYIPMQVSNLTNVVAVSAGDGHSCAVASDGTAWCWGVDIIGELGNGSMPDSDVPVPVSNLTNTVAISVGYIGGLNNLGVFSCAVASDGTAWCWGSGYRGRLGNGDFYSDSSTPVAVSGLTNALAISAANDHCCAVTADGNVWCWGDDRWGSLGQGEAMDLPAPVPVQVIGLTNAVTIGCGGWHCCVVTSDGTAWCWGDNQYGTLGDGSYSNYSSTPVQVTGLMDAVTISAGRNHSCAVVSDGTAWCWGAADHGALGDGSCSTLLSPRPVQVIGLTNAVAIAAGEFHSCAVISDGTAWCWGEGAGGKLGNGSNLDSCTPVQVSDLP